MLQLPVAARVYVTTVVVLGIAMFAVYLPQVQFEQPLLLAGLLLLSSMSAALKVYLPLTTGGSTMSVSYAVDFASLLLLGPHATMFVAAGSAIAQCNLNKKERNPLYRTLFSVASLIITVQGAGLAFHLLGGTGSAMPFTALARPLVGAATVYFLLNTGLVATAGSSPGVVVVTWNPSAWALSYKVKRAIYDGGPYTSGNKVTTTSRTETVTSGRRYYYVVTALNASGESSFSQQVSIVAP